MIPLIPFNDTCKIYRQTNQFDQYGNPTEVIVYEGACNYQIGSSGSTSTTGDMLLSTPRVFLPSIGIDIKQNDIVEINLDDAKTVKGLIEQWIEHDYQKMFGDKYEGIIYTKIWIVNEKRIYE